MNPSSAKRTSPAASGETRLLLILGAIVLLGAAAFGLLNYLSQQQVAANQPPPASSVKITSAQFDALLRDARHVKGDPNAAFTIVEFADFECGACRTAYSQITRHFGTGSSDVRFAFRHLPLPNHANARPAAMATEAAARQNKFWEMYALLFDPAIADPGIGLTREYFVQSARKIGLNVDRFERDMNDPAVAKQVEADEAAALSHKLEQTPSFLVRKHGSDQVKYLVGSRALGEYLSAQNSTSAKTAAAGTGPAPAVR
jgi:protein-disulfide isomerase